MRSSHGGAEVLRVRQLTSKTWVVSPLCTSRVNVCPTVDCCTEWEERTTSECTWYPSVRSLVPEEVAATPRREQYLRSPRALTSTTAWRCRAVRTSTPCTFVCVEACMGPDRPHIRMTWAPHIPRVTAGRLGCTETPHAPQRPLAAARQPPRATPAARARCALRTQLRRPCQSPRRKSA